MDSQCIWAWLLQHYPPYPIQLSILPYQNSDVEMCNTVFCVQQPVKFSCFWVVFRSTILLMKCSERLCDLPLFNCFLSIIWEIQGVFFFFSLLKIFLNPSSLAHWRNLKYQKCGIFERFISLWKCCKWQRRSWRGVLNSDIRKRAEKKLVNLRDL